jgi:hypothetical protein
MLGLVPEYMHSKNASDTPSDNCDSKKGCFRDTKGAAYGAPFVDTHESKP